MSPNVREWPTKDLFKRFPNSAKPKLWSYSGCRDDIIVLTESNSILDLRKMVIRGHPLLESALIVGQGKSRAALLLEPRPNAELPDQAVIETIWPLVEEADLVTHGWEGTSGETILMVKADRPFVRTGKGTIVRKRTEEVYVDEM